MKKILWASFYTLLVMLAFLVQSPYLAFALYAFLILLLLSHISSRVWLAGLDCERSISHTLLQQGAETEVTVTVTNRRGIPIPWIFIEDYYPAEFPIRGENMQLAILMPGRSIKTTYKLRCTRRGYHRVGPLLMQSGDLFGLQRRFRTGSRRDYISVLPTIAYIETYSIAARRPMGPVHISNRIYQDPTRINSLREYTPGDPLNSIHWKATARTGQLYVKTYEPSSVTGGALLLDLHEDSYFPEDREARIELAVTTTASIAYLLQMSGEQVGLLTNARDAAEVAQYEVENEAVLSRDEADYQNFLLKESTNISPLSVATRRGVAQATQIIENLSRVLPGHGLLMEQMLLSEARHVPRDAALLPVVPFVSPRLALALATMKDLGYAVTVFFINHQTEYMKAAQLLAPHNIYVFHIESERSLHEISPARIGQ